MRPDPSAERSARKRTDASGVPGEASWMSSVVLPSPVPGASSGSLLVAEARTVLAAGSHTSLTCHTACTGTIRWFGGQSVVGPNAKLRDGAIVSRTCTDDVQVAVFPDGSVALKVTPVVPNG